MNKRMDKYNSDNNKIPTRSDKNRELYRQIYNGYDEFENLVVPSNAKEISPMELKREITSRSQYKKLREYEDITNDEIKSNNSVIRSDIIQEQQKKKNEIYDIKELLNKAIDNKQETESMELKLTNEDYLKKLKIDSTKTNIEQVKEMYDEIREESLIEDESLIKTANLSLEILSDLKSDNDKTLVTPPIKDEELPDKMKDNDFYSNTYKFSKKDFEDREYEADKDDNVNDEFKISDSGNGKFFLKILLLILGISLVVIVIIYLFNYFNRV